ncbi:MULTISPECIES: hypothetical protein [Rhizobium]|uniref:Uncharacterized protein n=3 Tax=Rhizobium TaxID=379 RepID=A0A1C3XH38_9HYPH|nr:hypothetical protein RTCIAT899_PB02265 [Rhizobium tropici CIAT 899]ENN85774.1 hypothetical protein RHSP_81647 [Rhizobium freirei PRF 81]MBB4245229.1 hypothetical protein [Rhizobium tropici]MBB6489235.1 hypothetical protein [Rhizobium lusitanum]MBB5596507.1 hypothetical protein [Rhizobium tropici]
MQWRRAEATSEFGDLLDVIRESCGLVDFREVADEARRFLSMPLPPPQLPGAQRQPAAKRGSPKAARRLFAMSQPIAGTLPNDTSPVAAFCSPRMSARCASIPAATTGISLRARRRLFLP